MLHRKKAVSRGDDSGLGGKTFRLQLLFISQAVGERTFLLLQIVNHLAPGSIFFGERLESGGVILILSGGDIRVLALQIFQLTAGQQNLEIQP